MLRLIKFDLPLHFTVFIDSIDQWTLCDLDTWFRYLTYSSISVSNATTYVASSSSSRLVTSRVMLCRLQRGISDGR